MANNDATQEVDLKDTSGDVAPSMPVTQDPELARIWTTFEDIRSDTRLIRTPCSRLLSHADLHTSVQQARGECIQDSTGSTD
jgi:hypothetical protein